MTLWMWSEGENTQKLYPDFNRKSRTLWVHEFWSPETILMQCSGSDAVWTLLSTECLRELEGSGYTTISIYFVLCL